MKKQGTSIARNDGTNICLCCKERFREGNTRLVICPSCISMSDHDFIGHYCMTKAEAFYYYCIPIEKGRKVGE